MEQDGKVDQAASVARTGGSSVGNIMLTLCSPSDDAAGYQHAMIPFPPSYEAACAEALKTFAAYIPASTEAVSLRQAVKRMDGECVWGIIREDAWDTILKKEGEEIGVFLPDASPERFGYKKLHQTPEMSQNGRLDLKERSGVHNSSAGRLMLTLCVISRGSNGTPGYRRAVIPFPPSYEAARAEAIRVFARHMPTNTKGVVLRQAVQLKDGRYAWSRIDPRGWASVLETSGEEVGVFLPSSFAAWMPYDYLALDSKLVAYILPGGPSEVIIDAVRSWEECNYVAGVFGKQLGWDITHLEYDLRMVGSEAERKAYRQQKSVENWSASLVPDLFDYLVRLYPEPMRLRLISGKPSED